MLKKFKLTNKRLTWVVSFFAIIILIVVGVFTPTLFRLPAFAQDAIDLPAVELTPVASGLFRPVHITHAGDGSGRLFVVEQAGRIMILDGEQASRPFLDISDRVESPASGGGNEEGLLSVAFPRGYAKKGYFYVYYTQHTGDNVLSRFFITDDPNQADRASEQQLLVFPHPQYRNHNGGQIAFGPDGYLYIGTGDGGGSGDPLGNGQDPSSLNGKLLRIDVEMDPLKAQPGFRLSKIYWDYIWVPRTENHTETPYRVPEDNPFIAEPEFRPEIWALGLRNPWQFSFDRETGDLYIADVGQNRWEEVNIQPADSPGGENYGWNIMEGEECYGASDCQTAGLTLPVYVYPIFSAPECSITGGFVYRGDQIPALTGVYIFGDFCSGRIWGLQNNGDAWQSRSLADTNFMISTIGEDEQGEVYVADMTGGVIYALTGN